MDLMALLSDWGLPLVFASVLAALGGLPLPAAPILVGAGALAAIGPTRIEHVLLVAFGAAILADHMWFLLGRRFGRQLLGGICKLSLSPDTCVRNTDNMFSRFGAPLLTVAKLIPGVSTVAVPTSAAMGLSYPRFLLFDSVGILLWIGLYVGAGLVFSAQIGMIFRVLDWIGEWALVVVVTALVGYIGWKLWRRWSLQRLFRLVRISPDEMVTLLAEEPQALILDARSALARTDDPRMFPGAILLDGDRTVSRTLSALPGDAMQRTIVTFCTCPNEASAALLAKTLIDAGHQKVRVLTGGDRALALLAR